MPAESLKYANAMVPDAVFMNTVHSIKSDSVRYLIYTVFVVLGYCKAYIVLPENTSEFHSVISCVSAPPNYADVVSEEEFSRHVTAYPPPIDCEEQLCCPVFAYIQEFRFQPPPLYSEVKKIIIKK